MKSEYIRDARNEVLQLDCNFYGCQWKEVGNLQVARFSHVAIALPESSEIYCTTTTTTTKPTTTTTTKPTTKPTKPTTTTTKPTFLGKFEAKVQSIGQCSVPCGTGIQTNMSLLCQKMKIDGQIKNVCEDKFSYKEMPCNLGPCLAEYGPWSDWSDCSKPCLKTSNETSHKTRSRNCLTDDLTMCNKGRLETMTCKDVPLCPFESKFLIQPRMALIFESRDND